MTEHDIFNRELLIKYGYIKVHRISEWKYDKLPEEEKKEYKIQQVANDSEYIKYETIKPHSDEILRDLIAIETCKTLQNTHNNIKFIKNIMLACIGIALVGLFIWLIAPYLS